MKRRAPSPLRRLTVSALVVALSACAGLEIAGVNVGETVHFLQTLAGGNKLDPQQALKIGDELGAQLLGVEGPASAAELQAYVNRVGSLLVAQSRAETHGERWRFAVTDSAVMNAYSTPSGLVLISRGLLNVLDNEHELAAALSHEIAHVQLQHHVHNIERSKTMSAAAQLTGAALTGSGSGAGGVSAGILDISTDLYGKGMERDDELAADARAVEVMAKAGYDAFAFVTMLQKIEARSADQSTLSGFFLTHPKPADRIENVYASLELMPKARAVNEMVLQRRFDVALGRS